MNSKYLFLRNMYDMEKIFLISLIEKNPSLKRQALCSINVLITWNYQLASKSESASITQN